MAERPVLHFQRFEFKYLLVPDQAQAIESHLRHFMRLDPHIEKTAAAAYPVSTMYYDSPEYCRYYEKIDGQMQRFRFRVRTYALDPDDRAPLYLELKGRHNNHVFKHRSLLDTAGGLACRGASALPARVINAAGPVPLAERFAFEVVRRRLRPCLNIVYRRRPWIARLDPAFRVTFDTGLEAVRSDSLFPDPAAPRRRLFPGHVIMELKFRFHVPVWFHTLIASYNLQRRPLAKIGAGVEAFNLTPALQ